jgi:hypothetical protein
VTHLSDGCCFHVAQYVTHGRSMSSGCPYSPRSVHLPRFLG